MLALSDLSFLGEFGSALNRTGDSWPRGELATGGEIDGAERK